MTQKNPDKMTWAEWERADRPHMTLPNGDVLYEGDYGLTRDGERVQLGPWKYNGFQRVGQAIDGFIWYRDGVASANSPNSIIAKWVDQDAPKLWRDMTDAEKGALLLAHHEGKVIEYWSSLEIWAVGSRFKEDRAYRIKPEPKKPRELWLVVEDDGTVKYVSGIKPQGTYWDDAEIIHVREVMGDDQ